MEEFTPLNLFGDEKTEEESTVFVDEESAVETLVEDESVGDEVLEIEPTEEGSYETIPVSEEDVEEENDSEADSEDVQEEVMALEEEQAEPVQEKLNQVLESQQLILERIDSLDKLFDARIMHTDHEEKIVDQMHKELQKYKDDMYAQLVRPILLDVIEVRDSIMRMAAVYSAKPEGEQDVPNKTFAGYSFDLQDILEKNDVEIYRSKTGDDFTPIKQRVVKKVATPDETLHGKVAESLSCGYNYNGRTISAEKITIYFYEKPVEEKEDSEVMENG